jgi:hypothetical protein
VQGKRFEEILDKLFAVGMPVTRHPPHRSQHALLTHWAPASGINEVKGSNLLLALAYYFLYPLSFAKNQYGVKKEGN